MLEQIHKLSKEHNNTFPALAVILFNTSHAHIIEALKTQSYVDALDEISGEEIAVFWAALMEGRVELPSGGAPDTNGYMMPVYKEPSSNKSLYSFFDIQNGQSLPLLVTFSFDDENKIYFSKTRLVEGGAENAYNRLKEVLEDKANLIRDFSPELRADKEKMFKELGLFDSANEAAGLLRKFIGVAGRHRSATGI